MASFGLHGVNITATVSASAKISSSTDTAATITVTATGSIPNGYEVYSTGVVAEITINESSSGNKTIFGNASGWYYGSEGAKSVTYSVSVNKGTAAKSISWSVAFKNAVDGTIINTAHTATGKVSVPAKTSYTISYNANGGSGAPSSQTKWHGTALTLSSTKPTRTGYSFQGWATSASGSVAYAAGASYTANAAVTLYAVWKANTYTVSYNANGGSGAPSSQTKTYGTTLKLSSTKPTRTNYNFLGWATSASATAAQYAAGANYTANAAVTLYAVWELSYVKPRIFNLSAQRCNAAGTLTDDGEYALISFNFETDKNVSSIVVAWESASADSGSKTISASGMSGTVSSVVGGSLTPEASYSITITVTDAVDNSSATTTLNGSKFPIDAKAGGGGVSFGKPAELGKAESLGGSGVADFAFDAKFNEPVYGKALGMDRLPAIPENSDLNNYMETGCYAVQSNAIAATVANIPIDRAGRLEVWSATGEGIRSQQWSYLRQRYVPYNSSNAVWERDVARGEDNVWHYYDWWRSTLTPAAAEKVYHEPKILWEGGMYMTAGHTANLSESISAQPHGIVLTFSRYSGEALDEQLSSFFIPKSLISEISGCGHDFKLGGIWNAGAKYLYIHNDRIVGHEKNNQSHSLRNSHYRTPLCMLNRC